MSNEGVAKRSAAWFVRCVKSIGVLAAAAVLFTQTIASSRSQPSTFDVTPYLKPQKLVKIGGGRRLNVYCSGRGEPTVILEAGSGGDMVDWRFVQPLVSAHTRTCSYDRAGSGFSDMGPLPRDADAIASDLQQILSRANIAGPLILVGHSDGARYASVYADRNLHEVAGLVFVEPALDDYDERRAEAAAPKYAESTDEAKTIDRACALAEAQHRLRQGSPEYDACAPDSYDQLPPALLAVSKIQSRRAGWWKGYVSENIDDGATAREVRGQQRSFGNLPLVIFMADDALPAQTFPGTQGNAVMNILRQSRTALTHLSTRGSLVEVRACRRDETTRCAAEIAAAIDGVVAKVRSPL